MGYNCNVKGSQYWALPFSLLMCVGVTFAAGDSCSTVRDVRVVTGESAELYCHINNARDDPSKSDYYRKVWEKAASDGSTRVYLYRVNEDGSVTDRPGAGYEGRVVRRGHDVVQLSKVTEQDGGTYRCGWTVEPAITGCTGVTATFTVTIIVHVSKVKAEVSLPRTEGDDTLFRCTSIGTPPTTYTLHRVGLVTSGDRWTNTSELFRLSNIQRTDAGEYRCTADNEARRPQTSDAVTLEVYFHPGSVTVSASPPGPVSFGTTKTLTCSTDGANPAAHIKWTRDDVTATDDVTVQTKTGEYGAFVVSSTITIKTTIKQNGNIYKCNVNHMKQDLTGLARSFPLNITYPFRVSVSTSVNPVVEGNSTTLTCQPSDGNPQTVMSYEWRGPSPMATNSTVSGSSVLPAIGASKELIMTNVSYLDAGKYVCYVQNMGGVGSDYAFLKVLYTAKLHLDIPHVDQISAEYNQTVKFSLHIIANPLPTYKWSRTYDNKESPLLPKSKVTSNGFTSNLTIPVVTQLDMLSYTCRVENAVGRKVFLFKLVLATSHLDKPSKFSIVYASAISVTLQWTAGFNGGTEQTFSVMYRVAEHSWPQHPQITGIPDPGQTARVVYKVVKLTESTVYEFRVRAENERQNGERISPYTTIIQGKTQAKPFVDGNKLTVIRKSSDAIAVGSWSEPRGFYTIIKIKVCEKREMNCRLGIVNSQESNTTTLIGNLKAELVYKYMLQLYDRDDLVYESGATSSTTQDVSGRDNDPVIGALAGLLVVTVAIGVALAISLALVIRRQISSRKSGRKDESNQPTYENTIFQDVLHGSSPERESNVSLKKDELDCQAPHVYSEVTEYSRGTEVNQYEQLKISDKNGTMEEEYSQLKTTKRTTGQE